MESVTARRLAGAAVFAAGASLAAYGLLRLWAEVCAPPPPTTGGVGAVGAGAVDVVVDTVPVLGALLINVLVIRRLTRRAIDLPRLAGVIRYGHLLVTLGYLIFSVGSCAPSLWMNRICATSYPCC